MDHFPNETAVVRKLLRDGLERQAIDHVMVCYRSALLAYARGCSITRAFHEAGTGTTDEDLVHEFLVARVGREGFLRQWLESGARFRYWLIVSFRNLLKDRRKAELRRMARRGGGEVELDADDTDRDAERCFDAALARSVVAEAVEIVCRHARERGLDDHWEVFRRHRLEGRTRRAVAEELDDLDRDVAAVVRTVERWLREAIRTLVRWPGATEAQIEAEIARLMKAVTT